MNSMTGFGRADLSKNAYRLQVQLSSVNSRFLEFIFRMPRTAAAFEQKIKDLLAEKINRGKITVTVNLDQPESGGPGSTIDQAAAQAYHKQLLKLNKRLGVSEPVRLEHILANEALFINPLERIDEKTLWADLKKVLHKAADELIRMRAAEGRNLQQMMRRHIKEVERLVASIHKLSPKIVDAYKKRLEKRINEVGSNLDIDAQRIAEEVTIFAERSDVTEECTRLISHIDLFRKTLDKKGIMGKRLNFILQEMGRESNTIGSKAISNRTATLAIALKEEIEKLREQAQNIE